MALPMAPSNATVAAYVASLIARTTPGIVYRVTVYNSNASAQFIQIHDATTLPADNAVPAVVVKVAGASSAVIEFQDRGRRFANGVVVCNSSTGPTKTIGTTDCWFDVQHG